MGRKLGSYSRGDKELTALLLAAFAFSCTTIYLATPSLNAITSLRPSPIILGGSSSGAAAGDDNDRNATSNQSNTITESTTMTTTISSASRGAPRSSISDLIAWILIGNDKDANTHHAALSRLNDSPENILLEFLPGSLPLSHVQTLQHCYADPSIYNKHFQGGRGDGSSIRVSYSEKYRLAYVMLPKCASSTARHVLKNEFQATESRMSLQPKEFENDEKETNKLEVITFVRDPLSRFYSQYDEAYVRTAPWQQQQKDSSNTAFTHPYPFLYENIRSYHEYEDVFCPIDTRTDRKDCVFRESKENGTLASRFERFVKEYDGRDPFDVQFSGFIIACIIYAFLLDLLINNLTHVLYGLHSILHCVV
jgi:hypothetical protein